MKQLKLSADYFKRTLQESDGDESSEYEPPEEKPSQKIPDQWSRIQHVQQTRQQRAKVWSVESDIETDKRMQQIRNHSSGQTGIILFNPDCWKGQSSQLNQDKYSMTKQELFQFGSIASKIRERFQHQVSELMSQDLAANLQVSSSVSPSLVPLKRGYEREKPEKIDEELLKGVENDSQSRRRKKFTLSQLSQDSRDRIIRMATIGSRTYDEIGGIFNVKTQVVQYLLSSSRQKKSMKIRRATKFMRKTLQHDETRKLVSAQIEKFAPIWSIKQVQDQVRNASGFKVSKKVVQRVMKDDLHLSYRKVKKISFLGNSERCKVLRSLYAQKMLQIYSSNQRVINIDESSINEADYRQRQWRKRGEPNTLPDKVLRQKVNIITALSSDGDVWFALTTCNTDTDIFKLFMTRFATELSKKYQNWRSNTVFLLDGASYHKSNQIIDCYKSLGLKVILSAPYSYASAPVELWFARLKCGDLNPQNLGTGKRSFKEVIELVLSQARKIPKDTIIRCFRHVIEYLFLYLTFKPL